MFGNLNLKYISDKKKEKAEMSIEAFVVAQYGPGFAHTHSSRCYVVCTS